MADPAPLAARARDRGLCRLPQPSRDSPPGAWAHPRQFPGARNGSRSHDDSRGGYHLLGPGFLLVASAREALDFLGTTSGLWRCRGRRDLTTTGSVFKAGKIAFPPFGTSRLRGKITFPPCSASCLRGKMTFPP